MAKTDRSEDETFSLGHENTLARHGVDLPETRQDSDDSRLLSSPAANHVSANVE